MKNSKKYSPVFQDNINSVWNTLKQYPPSCQKAFLKNLKNLHIKINPNVYFNPVYLTTGDPYAIGGYFHAINTIYLKEDMNDVINHELFHVASSTTRKNGIITIKENRVIGYYLNEGITEYLNLKSQKQLISKSDYQLEVFVIEFLIKIYGEKILIPYFTHNSIKFFTQFQKHKKSIIKIDNLLSKIKSNNENNQQELFNTIIKILIVIAKDNNLSTTQIKEILIDTLSTKKEGLEVINYKNKKLIKE